MRILHVMTKGDVGGAQTAVVSLATAQRRAGHDVTVAVGTDGPAMAAVRASDVPVAVVGSLAWSVSVRGDRVALRDLRRLVADNGPDVVHAHSSKAGLLARIAARRAGVPSVYTAHGWPFQTGAPLRQRALSLTGEFLGGRLGDAIICLTEREAALARRARVAPPRRIFIVPNGLADVPPELRWRDRSCGLPRVVMVARFGSPKLQSEVIGALERLLDVPWSMTFVGDGPELECCRETGKRLLGDRVRFLGHRDDVPALLCESDVAVLWSRYEGMPIALMEAMRAGLCCVASDLPGVRTLFGSPPAGVVAANDPELAAALRSVLADERARRSLGRAARQRFETSFTLDRMVRATDEVYEAVLAHRGM